jgi:hypothetical protein
MKQTAVIWLQKSLSLTYQQQMQFEGLFQQAIEIEKEQICDAFYYGVKVDEWTIENPYTQAEQYYKETYGK